MNAESSRSKIYSRLNLLAGIWLVLSPWILSYGSIAARWYQTFFGLVVLGLFLYQRFSPEDEWRNWLNGAFGLWLIVSPFLLNYASSLAYWNQVAAGLVVAIVGFWSMDLREDQYNYNS